MSLLLRFHFSLTSFRKNVSILYMKQTSANISSKVINNNSHENKQRRKKKNQKNWIEYDYDNIDIREDFGVIKENKINEIKAPKITKIYDSISHMSQKEKEIFEQKFNCPKNKSQHLYVELLKKPSKKIVVANGPAGTGKTLFATEMGVRYFLTDKYEKVIFTRPSVSVDEDLGYLPGTLEEKMAPWVRPIYDILYNFFSTKQIGYLMEEKIIEIAPLGYMRGRTFQNAWIVADEMQNCTISQMKMLLTRLGDNSKLVVTGDLDQRDQQLESNGLYDFLRRFKNTRSDSISSFEFDKSDIQREPVVKEVLDIYGSDCIPNDNDDIV